MADRYFVAEPVTGQEAELTGQEAHHLLHVMRAEVGTEVVLFDGSGAEFEAVVERLGRRSVELSVVHRREVDRELAAPIILAVALPKGDRQKWLVEKAVELGVARVTPLQTARSVARPGRKAMERLQRTVIEASKQCGRNRRMDVAEPAAWNELLAAAPQSALRLLAHPGGGSSRLSSLSLADRTGPVYVAVGPEGGFTGEEVGRAIRDGWQTVDLGPRILRVETAAVALAAHLSLLAQRGW